MYSGEGTPRGYEYPLPDSRAGSSVTKVAKKELSEKTLKGLKDSVNQQTTKTKRVVSEKK
jgi:hypothetical protein